MFPLLQSFQISNRNTVQFSATIFSDASYGWALCWGREQNFPWKLNGSPDLVLVANIYWILPVGQAKGECITRMWLILMTDEKVEAQERLSDLSKVSGLRVVDPGLANHELLANPEKVRWQCAPRNHLSSP